MTGRVVVWCEDPDAKAVQAAADFAAQAAGAEVEIFGRAEAAVERGCATAPEGRPCLLVLAPGSMESLPSLRRLSRDAREARCLFALHAQQVPALRRALTFVPAPGGRWHIEHIEDPDLGKRMLDALTAVTQGRRLRTTLDGLRLRLAAPAEVDSMEHRRLITSNLFFSTVLRQATDAIVSMDERGIVQTWNAGAIRMFDRPEADAVGQPLAPLFADASAAASLVQAAASGTSGKAEFETVVAGEPKHVEITVDGIRDERGTRLGVVAVLRDITEQRRAQRVLVDTAREKDEFLAMLAHELRNPLSPIRSAAQLLRLLDTGDARIRRASDIISRQVEHLSGLVDDLLDVARVTRGAVTLERRPTDVHGVVAAAVEQARSLIDSKHQLLEVQADDDLYVFGDADRLVQVLANLMNNAAKFTDDAGKILLTARGQEGEVVVTVSDNGIGVAPELLPHVFELFTQGKRSPDRSQGGLGIGLALVKTLVELHGGRVSAESAGPQSGSTFTVVLPRISGPHAEPPATPARKMPHDAAGSRLRMMVVDDNADAARTLAEWLEAQGHMVVVHDDPVDALAKAGEVAPDVFILDIGMPRMNGYDLARQLRNSGFGHRAVMIALTGYGQPEDRLRSTHAGFDHHLVKPLDADLLTSLLEQVIPARQ